MSPADEPTNWEIVRRISEIENDQKDLERRLSEARERGDEKYVRKDVWLEARRFDSAVVADIAKDVAEVRDDRRSDATWRRQVMFGLAIAFIGLLGTITVTVVNLVAK